MPAPPSISTKDIASTLVLFNIRLSEEQLLAVQKYIGLLLLWNQKVSLTSIDDPAEIVSRHFAESIFGGKMLVSASCRLADVGSGAGFPGLPLKIAFPQLRAVLIEPNLKKCAFLAEVIAALGLRDVEVFRDQYSAFRDDELALKVNNRASEPDGFDVICSRALGDYKSLLRWAKTALGKDGRVLLWLGDEDAILLTRAKGWSWDTPVRIPESSKRVIIEGRPI